MDGDFEIKGRVHYWSRMMSESEAEDRTMRRRTGELTDENCDCDGCTRRRGSPASNKESK